MSYVRAHRLPIKPTPASSRPMAGHFPVSRDQLTDFVAAHQAEEKRREEEAKSSSCRGKG